MDSEPYPCWQAGLRFERDPIFSLTHFHTVKWPIPRVISAVIMMALTSIHTPSLLLCLFILAYCLPVDPHHGDNITDVDQSVLACSHTFNDQSSTPHSPCVMLQLTCQQHPRCSYCQQQAPRPTFCARPTHQELLRSPFPFLLDFDLQETFFCRPSSRVLFFRRLQYHPFWMTPTCSVWTAKDLRHNLHIFLWRFIFVMSLQSSPDIVCYGSVLFSVSV